MPLNCTLKNDERGKFCYIQFTTIKNKRSSGQDGGIGRNPSLPRTTKRRITTNLKSINNQKCQKIKLHGTQTTKELKKKSPRTTRPESRQAGRLRKTSARQQRGRAGCWALGLLGRGWFKGKTETLSWLWAGVAAVGVTPNLTGDLESALETGRSAALFPLWPLPHRQHWGTAQQGGLPCPGEYLRPRPLATYQVRQDKEIWPKWKNTAHLQKQR